MGIWYGVPWQTSTHYELGRAVWGKRGMMDVGEGKKMESTLVCCDRCNQWLPVDSDDCVFYCGTCSQQQQQPTTNMREGMVRVRFVLATGHPPAHSHTIACWPQTPIADLVTWARIQFQLPLEGVLVTLEHNLRTLVPVDAERGWPQSALATPRTLAHYLPMDTTTTEVTIAVKVKYGDSV